MRTRPSKIHFILFLSVSLVFEFRLVLLVFFFFCPRCSTPHHWRCKQKPGDRCVVELSKTLARSVTGTPNADFPQLERLECTVCVGGGRDRIRETISIIFGYYYYFCNVHGSVTAVSLQPPPTTDTCAALINAG